MIRRIFTYLALCLWLSSCGDSTQEHVATPRRTAYPRITLYDTIYRTAPEMPLQLLVNAAAHLSTPATSGAPGTTWLDVEYPAYKATLHLTLRSVEPGAADSEIERRIERMSLNLGDNAATQLSIPSASGKFSTIILSTTGRSLTPVQILSTGPGWIISGALQWHEQNTLSHAADSISPIVEAVTTDLIHTARAL